MERLEAIALIESSRAEWDQLIASVPRERMLESLWENGWNVRDVVAHVDFYEWWVGEFIRKRDWPETDASLNTQDTDQRNAALYELNKDRPLDDVLSQSASMHEGFVRAVTSLTDDEFKDTKLLLDPPPDDLWTVERMVASNTWDHYPQHAPDIRKLLSR